MGWDFHFAGGGGNGGAYVGIQFGTGLDCWIGLYSVGDGPLQNHRPHGTRTINIETMLLVLQVMQRHDIHVL